MVFITVFCIVFYYVMGFKLTCKLFESRKLSEFQGVSKVSEEFLGLVQHKESLDEIATSLVTSGDVNFDKIYANTIDKRRSELNDIYRDNYQKLNDTCSYIRLGLCILWLLVLFCSSLHL